MTEPDAMLVLARAKRNFAIKGHGDRVWDRAEAEDVEIRGTAVLPLSEEERAEYLEQARHELRRETSP
ncbi:hypothetical protein [Methylobacterium nigriterrae]|uniref:hypothetical protein n=1 Tax=Methylobacterium nigriterrae TaxID=3127512 RepID=UPI003013A3D2